MRVGFRPRPSTAGGHEEHRGQGSAGSANAQEEGRGSAKAGGRPPEGGTRPPEEDKRPRAKGTAAADKPAEEGAKRAEEESRLPTAAEPEIGEVGPGRPNSAYPAVAGNLLPLAQPLGGDSLLLILDAYASVLRPTLFAAERSLTDNRSAAMSLLYYS